MATIKEIRERVDLAPEFAISGSGLKYKIRCGKRFAGDMAGCLHTPSGYYHFKIKGKVYKAHHIVSMLADLEGWQAVRKGELVIYHINGSKGDNRPKNLRCITVQANTQNQAHHRAGSIAGIRKVKSGKYEIRATINGSQRGFGTHCYELAIEKREGIRRYFGV